MASLTSDLKHTMSARAQAEGREDEAWNNLRVTEGELREVRDDLRAAQNDFVENQAHVASCLCMFLSIFSIPLFLF